MEIHSRHRAVFVPFANFGVKRVVDSLLEAGPGSQTEPVERLWRFYRADVERTVSPLRPKPLSSPSNRLAPSNSCAIVWYDRIPFERGERRLRDFGICPLIAAHQPDVQIVRDGFDAVHAQRHALRRDLLRVRRNVASSNGSAQWQCLYRRQPCAVRCSSPGLSAAGEGASVVCGKTAGISLQVPGENAQKEGRSLSRRRSVRVGRESFHGHGSQCDAVLLGLSQVATPTRCRQPG